MDMGKQLWNKFTGILLAAAMLLTAICPAAVVQADEEAPSEQRIQYSFPNTIKAQNYGKWSKPVTSYLVPLENGGLMSVFYASSGKQKVILAGYYEPTGDDDEPYQYNELRAKTIGLELPLFGGFYATENYYFILTGQNNLEQSPDKTVYRITKYDKNWVKTGEKDFKNCNTTRPFAFGTARMDAYGEDYLLIRTCHEMYKSRDGYNHQANVAIQLDIKKMEITSSVTGVGGAGYVSHSFNQFVKVDGDRMVTADHGDAYPRGVILAKYNGSLSSGKFGNSSRTTVLSFKGGAGNIVTNATVGGLEISPSSYLLAGNSIDQSAGSTSAVWNIFVTAADKNLNNKELKWLTDYEKTSGTVPVPTTPHLVKMNDDEFLVLWQTNTDKDTIFCTKINGKGEVVMPDLQEDSQKEKFVSLPGNLSDCVPVAVTSTTVSGSSLMWSTVSNASKTAKIELHRIKMEDLTGTLPVSPGAITVSSIENPLYPVSDVTTIENTSSGSGTDDITTAPIESDTNSPSSSGSSWYPSGTVIGNSTRLPILKDSNGRQGWDAILAAAEKAAAAPEGGTVTVDMNGISLVPGRVFAGIRGRDVTVIFDMGKGIQWSVYGKDITAETVSDIDLSIKTGAGNIPQDVADSMADGHEYLKLSLAHEGPFGFAMTLSLKLASSTGGLTAGSGTAEKYRGMYANLFYYNPALRSLEFISTGRIGEDGTADLAMAHASDYMVIVSRQPMGGTEDVKDPSEVQQPENPQELEEDTQAKVKSVKLSKTVYTYNGKAKKPSVTAVDTNGRKISSKYYTVSYKDNKKAGKATATVTFKGSYSGTVKKTFTIRPAGTIIQKTAAVSKGFTVKWKKKTAQTSGYQIQYSTNAGFKGSSTHSVFVKKTSTVSRTIKNLKAKKTYYVRIRTCKTIETGGKSIKIGSAWSAAKKVRTLSP